MCLWSVCVCVCDCALPFHQEMLKCILRTFNMIEHQSFAVRITTGCALKTTGFLAFRSNVHCALCDWIAFEGVICWGGKVFDNINSTSAIFHIPQFSIRSKNQNNFKEFRRIAPETICGCSLLHRRFCLRTSSFVCIYKYMYIVRTCRVG